MRHALRLVISVLVSGRISSVCTVNKRAAATSAMDGLGSPLSCQASCRRHEKVPGLPGQYNDVIVCGDMSTAKKHVIFFGGDVQKSTSSWTYWRCSVRNKNTTCPASVIQFGASFEEGKHRHCHPPQPGQLTAIRVRVEVKEQAVNNVYKSGASIVEEAQQKLVNPEKPGGRQKQSTLIRMANRTRELLRPKEPRSLDFELEENFLPEDFFRHDIGNKGERHLMFATDRQLQHLSMSRQWFMDGTFKIVKMPFHQLLTIHAFVRAGSDFKLMPLVFVIMSRRRTSDYVCVMKALLDILPRTPNLKTIVLDFELAAWKALKKTLPDIRVRGCLFHLTQAVWRKCQELGLQDYPERMSNHRDNKRYLQWNLENTAQIILKRFQDSAVFVIKPSSMHLNTFSVYSSFVETNAFGSPSHSHSPQAWIHLKPLYCNVVSKELAKQSESTCKDTCDTEVPLTLIGFSKGCVVLNQMLYSLSLAEEYPKIKDFINRVEEFYWLDGGHSGGQGSTWISDTESLQNLSNLKTKIYVHVTPYQVRDPMRAWVGKEEKKFVSKLKKFGADITETLHFDDLPASIENHFGVLQEF